MASPVDSQSNSEIIEMPKQQQKTIKWKGRSASCCSKNVVAAILAIIGVGGLVGSVTLFIKDLSRERVSFRSVYENSMWVLFLSSCALLLGAGLIYCCGKKKKHDVD